jgi:hypothetical protein
MLVATGAREFRADSAGRRAVLSFVRKLISRIASMNLADRVTVVGPTRSGCGDDASVGGRPRVSRE